MKPAWNDRPGSPEPLGIWGRDLDILGNRELRTSRKHDWPGAPTEALHVANGRRD